MRVELYVVNSKSQFGGVDSVTVYAAGASGNNTTLPSPGGIAVDASGNIYVANYANNANTITVFAPGANGNVAADAARALTQRRRGPMGV